MQIRSELKALLYLLLAMQLQSLAVFAAGDDEIGSPLDHFVHDHPSPMIDFAAIDAPHYQSPVTIDLTGDTFGSNEASSSSSSHMQPVMAQAMPEPPATSVVVPRLGVSLVPENEKWHIKRSLKTRLAQARIDHSTFTLQEPLFHVRDVHLEILRRQLQHQIDSKQAVYLTPTWDYRGRIVAIPIHRDRVKEMVIESQKTGRVGWAIVSVHPGPPPTMTYISYALLDVPDRGSFVNKLTNSRNVKALKDYLVPRA